MVHLYCLHDADAAYLAPLIQVASSNDHFVPYNLDGSHDQLTQVRRVQHSREPSPPNDALNLHGPTPTDPPPLPVNETSSLT